MVRTTVGVECGNCGLTCGHFESGGNARCDDCGRYATPSSDYCATHNINIRNLSGYKSCPRCEQERSVRAQEQEMMERRADPRMHPTVDAPRY